MFSFLTLRSEGRSKAAFSNNSYETYALASCPDFLVPFLYHYHLLRHCSFRMYPVYTKEGRYAIVKKWCRAVVGLMRTICGVRYEITGMDNVPASGPVILLSKHQSGWETLAFFALVPRRLSYIYSANSIVFRSSAGVWLRSECSVWKDLRDAQLLSA